MTPIDIHFCGELLRSVGAGLYDTCKRGERAASVPDLFNRFQLANNPATLQLKTALVEKYPNIRWSDSEFETENQQKVEYEGEYCFVYDPSHDELFYAVAGEGAFLNGKPIRVAAKEKLMEAIVCTTPPSFPANDIEITDLTLRGFNHIIPRAFAVRMLGSISLQLAYTACGRLDGYYEFGDEIYNWIAGALLVQEAGGVVSDRHGNSFTWGTSGIIASNPILHQNMKEELNAISS